MSNKMGGFHLFIVFLLNLDIQFNIQEKKKKNADQQWHEQTITSWRVSFNWWKKKKKKNCTWLFPLLQMLHHDSSYVVQLDA